MRDRLPISILLVPIAMWIIGAGREFYLLGILFIFWLASNEYVKMFRTGQSRPARPLVVGGTLLLIASRELSWLNPHGLLFALIIIGALWWHLSDYELGAVTSGTDFAITIGGVFYLGWLGGYLIDIRNLPDGLWWLVIVMPGMWLADTGAYIFGRLWGRHKMSPRLSPRKTWEGYAGSVLCGALGAGLLAMFWRIGAGPNSLVSWPIGALVGAAVGALGPLGDLGVSMLKRQIGVKDASDLLHGHGGALDRMDSWLVAAPVGYYLVVLLQWWMHKP